MKSLRRRSINKFAPVQKAVRLAEIPKLEQQLIDLQGNLTDAEKRYREIETRAIIAETRLAEILKREK